jgi:hypothetical protein
MVIREILSKVPLVFASVRGCGILVEPIITWPNERLAGERLTVGVGAGGAGGLGLPPPPPQAAQTPTTNTAAANSQPAGRRRASLMSDTEVKSPPNNQGQPTGRRGCGGTLIGEGGTRLLLPPVLTMSVVVMADGPVTVSVEGETPQVIPAHPVAQEKYAAPVYPPRGVNVTVEVPVLPGAEILMVAGSSDNVKSVTVSGTVAEVEPM